MRKLEEVVSNWSWNATPKEARAEWMRLGFTKDQVAKEMQKQGYKHSEICKVVCTSCVEICEDD